MSNSTLDVEASDVVRLILQFCKENNLTQSYAAIQLECQTSLNVVDSVEGFVSDVLNGRWDVVLPTVAHLRLPKRKLEDLYEQVVLELIEARECDSARTMLRQTVTMVTLKQEQPERHGRLERLLSHSGHFDVSEAYPEGTSRDKRRAAIARALEGEVSVAPPSRLLALLGQALKWQREQGLLPSGAAFDLFRGVSLVERDEEDACPAEEHRIINFGKKNHAECATFSPDGISLATGSTDGFIEIYDWSTGKLRKDLSYQAEDMLMMHDDSVLALDFSPEGDMLASGSRDGKMKVWRVCTGQCLRKFDRAHSEGVTSVCFSRDGHHVLSSSFDGTVRIHGLKSGKLLKEMRGHATYVNDARYASEGERVLSASSDGTVRVWDAKTCEPLAEVRPPQPRSTASSGADATLTRVIPFEHDPERFVVCQNGNSVHLMTTSGAVRSFTTEAASKEKALISCTVSPKESWIYAPSMDGTIHCFSVADEDTKVVKVDDKNALGICHHPRKNILATFSSSGLLRVWMP